MHIGAGAPQAINGIALTAIYVAFCPCFDVSFPTRSMTAGVSIAVTRCSDTVRFLTRPVSFSLSSTYWLAAPMAMMRSGYTRSLVVLAPST